MLNKTLGQTQVESSLISCDPPILRKRSEDHAKLKYMLEGIRSLNISSSVGTLKSTTLSDVKIDTSAPLSAKDLIAFLRMIIIK
ncbi:hypothetical protein BpHYR1_040829 [Brachionus plicatilis]|uniref:Uncharacterized protein n=1 Tax=Brachionus plicatilis TaxID=10195 RepID=A0A3M7S0A8_BRAPC|nr:hypothetical protein BpHYR1_040829 [Brachionus plicatilis]